MCKLPQTHTMQVSVCLANWILDLEQITATGLLSLLAFLFEKHRIANFSSKWFAPNSNIIHYINMLAKFLHEDRFPPDNRHKMSSFMHVGSRTHVNSRGCREGMHSNGLSMFMKMGSCGSVCKWGISPKLPFNGEDVWLSQFGVYPAFLDKPVLQQPSSKFTSVLKISTNSTCNGNGSNTSQAIGFPSQNHHEMLNVCGLLFAESPTEETEPPGAAFEWPLAVLSSPLVGHIRAVHSWISPRSINSAFIRRYKKACLCPVPIIISTSIHISHFPKYRTLYHRHIQQWFRSSLLVHHKNHPPQVIWAQLHRPVLPGDRKADGPAAGDGSDRLVL